VKLKTARQTAPFPFAWSTVQRVLDCGPSFIAVATSNRPARMTLRSSFGEYPFKSYGRRRHEIRKRWCEWH
jgi:hypothetical protein